jgi:hypothetical protein
LSQYHEDPTVEHDADIARVDQAKRQVKRDLLKQGASKSEARAVVHAAKHEAEREMAAANKKVEGRSSAVGSFGVKTRVFLFSSDLCGE